MVESIRTVWSPGDWTPYSGASEPYAFPMAAGAQELLAGLCANYQGLADSPVLTTDAPDLDDKADALEDDQFPGARDDIDRRLTDVTEMADSLGQDVRSDTDDDSEDMAAQASFLSGQASAARQGLGSATTAVGEARIVSVTRCHAGIIRGVATRTGSQAASGVQTWWRAWSAELTSARQQATAQANTAEEQAGSLGRSVRSLSAAIGASRSRRRGFWRISRQGPQKLADVGARVSQQTVDLVHSMLTQMVSAPPRR